MTTTPAHETRPAIEVTLNAEQLFAGWREPDGDDGSYEIPLGEEILARAATQLLQRLAADKDYYTPLRDKVRQIRDEEIRAAVQPLVAEALTASLQPTDSWGQPKGEPITLREVIVSEAEKYLRTPDGPSYGDKRNPVRKFISDEVDRAVKAELQKAVQQAKAEVVAAVKGHAAEIITKTITDMAGVR